MIIELERSLVEWLQDGTNGITAQLALFTHEAGYVAPTVGTIAGATTNDLVALEKLPSIPGVAVNTREMPALDNQVQIVTGDGVMRAWVRIGVSKTATKDAIRDLSYLLRATLRSLRLFNHDNRTRNQIQIWPAGNIVAVPNWPPIEDCVVTGGFIGDWNVRDTSTL